MNRMIFIIVGRNCQVLSPFLIEETRMTVSPSTMILDPRDQQGFPFWSGRRW